MQKPRFSVTYLLSYLYPYKETEVSEVLRAHGKTAHSIICENYKSNDYDCEVKLELDRGFYILVGIADIIDHERYLVIEAKPQRTLRNLIKSRRARLQLSAYVAMHRKLTNGTIENGYYGAWLAYNWNNPLRFSIIKPFYLDMTVLSLLDSIARQLLREKKNDKNNRPSEDSEIYHGEVGKGSTVLGQNSIREQVSRDS